MRMLKCYVFSHLICSFSKMSFWILLMCVIQTMYALPIISPAIYSVTPNIVKEGDAIKLLCDAVLSASDSDPITWSWICGNEDLTINSTAQGRFSDLSFTANRRHNDQHCHCRAKARNSKNETYDRNSRYLVIRVSYTPSTPPKLNVSAITLHQDEEATLGCSIDSLGNPPITWSWTCGTQSIYKRLQTNGQTTSVVIRAEPDLNGESCYCTASRSGIFQIVSEMAYMDVFYNPTDYPRISSSNIGLDGGFRVNIQCSLSSSGNPPITWSWYCNDVIVTEGVRHRDRSTELSFFADVTDDSKECYCRARSSRSISGILYDRNSSISFIKLSGRPSVEQSDIGCTGLSLVAFSVVLSILLFSLALCSVIIFVQHKNIPKKSSLMTCLKEKIGKKSGHTRQPSNTDVACGEHKYEELREGIKISNTRSSSPKLNISKVTLNPGEEKTLGCVIDSLGNPQITWSWTCGTQSMNRRVQTR